MNVNFFDQVNGTYSGFLQTSLNGVCKLIAYIFCEKYVFQSIPKYLIVSPTPERQHKTAPFSSRQ